MKGKIQIFDHGVSIVASECECDDEATLKRTFEAIYEELTKRMRKSGVTTINMNESVNSYTFDMEKVKFVLYDASKSTLTLVICY